VLRLTESVLAKLELLFALPSTVRPTPWCRSDGAKATEVPPSRRMTVARLKTLPAALRLDPGAC